ncbi:hypothetical protein DJ83_11170 [Halorubrum ezzemoulense]|uniref:Envelope protein N-terminal domain-containing protein n=1 Tax=Halorubrum ezzemoulense TaxID=337243 RepID=A0A256IU92_HALEZ|nr:hypothetical protein [Halorubrum ezzemoulense]OYR59846.1 hypothetical protein DJ83_11170 [Halorubrum ezzemoulense]
MRTAAGATAVGVVGASGALPEEVDPVDDVEAIGITAAVGIGIVAGAAVGAAGTYFVTKNDSKEIKQSLAWEDHLKAYNDAEEQWLRDDQALASLSRDAQLVNRKAREDAIYEIYDHAVQGADKSTTEKEANQAVDEAFSVPEKAILSSFSARVETARKALKNAGSNVLAYNQSWGTASDTGTKQMDLEVSDETGQTAEAQFETRVTSRNLLNGDTVDISVVDSRRSAVTSAPSAGGSPALSRLLIDPSSPNYDGEENPWGVTDPNYYSTIRLADGVAVEKPAPTDYDTGSDITAPEGPEAQLWLTAKPWYNILQTLYTKHSETLKEVPMMMDQYYDDAASGEIDLEQMMAPKHLAGSAENAENAEQAALILRSMGYPQSDQKLVIETQTQNGDTVLLEGFLSWIGHSGSSLEVGKQYDPSGTPGRFYMAYGPTPQPDDIQTEATKQYESADSHVVELTESFAIVGTEKDGTTSISFESRNMATADTSPSDARETFRKNDEAEKDAREETVEVINPPPGAGAGGGGVGLGALAALVGGGGVLAYILGGS